MAPCLALRWSDRQNELPPTLQLRLLGLTLSGEPPKKGDDREGNFLKDLREGFHRFSPKEAAAEINNWGGWWRNRYRETPDKAQRVLHEVLSMIKERKIKRHPGAAGVDLWNRLP